MSPTHPGRTSAARTLAVLTSAIAVALGTVAVPVLASARSTESASLARVLSDPVTYVPGEYIVKTRDGGERERFARYATSERIMRTSVERARSLGATITREYNAIGGYAAQLTEEQLDAVRRDPNVEYVQRNGTHQLRDMVGDGAYFDAPETRGSGTQRRATWGLDRIDQKRLPLDKTYSYKQSGVGVNVYIMDTGITSRHNEFRGRIKGGSGWSTENGRFTSSMEDCQGHGTHVAGTAAGKEYGVAKEANIWALRIFNCDGDNEDKDTISAANWMIQNGQRPGVVNMSFSDDKAGSDGSAADQALRRIVTEAGIHIAAAAGNQSKDACRRGPGWMPETITVGNTTSRDGYAGSSNYGRCVDISAPGTDIRSAKVGTSSGTSVKTGTSMASPHVCGAVALYLEANPQSTPPQTKQALTRSATNGAINRPPRGTPNLLLYVLDFPTAPAPPRPTPTNTPAPPRPTPTNTPAPPQPTPTNTRPPWPPRPTPTNTPAPPQPTRPRPTWPNPPGWPGWPGRP